MSRHGPSQLRFRRRPCLVRASSRLSFCSRHGQQPRWYTPVTMTAAGSEHLVRTAMHACLDRNISSALEHLLGSRIRDWAMCAHRPRDNEACMARPFIPSHGCQRNLPSRKTCHASIAHSIESTLPNMFTREEPRNSSVYWLSASEMTIWARSPATIGPLVVPCHFAWSSATT